MIKRLGCCKKCKGWSICKSFMKKAKQDAVPERMCEELQEECLTHIQCHGCKSYDECYSDEDGVKRNIV